MTNSTMKTFALLMTCCCLLVAAYPTDLEFLESEPHHLSRQKRQTGWGAMDLASKHNDRNGNPLTVGKPYLSYDFSGSGRNLNNYRTNAKVGVRSVIYESPDRAHSVGVAAHGSQSGGRDNGRWSSSPIDYGVGVGYRFNF